MKKTKTLALLTSLLSVFSSLSSAHAAGDDFKKRNQALNYANLNDKEYILSTDGKNFFNKLVHSATTSKADNENQFAISNPNAGKKRVLTEKDKMLMLTTPLMASVGIVTILSVHNSVKTTDRDDTDGNYIDVIGNYEVPATWLSLKSLICICEYLCPGLRVKTDMKSIYVPKGGGMSVLLNDKEKIDYDQMNNKFLAAIQRAAVHGDPEKGILAPDLKKWMEKNGFDKLSDDELIKKWKHIDSNLQTFIKSRFLSDNILSNKPSLYNFVNNLPGESLDEGKYRRIIKDAGLYDYEKPGDKIDEIKTLTDK